MNSPEELERSIFNLSTENLLRFKVQLETDKRRETTGSCVRTLSVVERIVDSALINQGYVTSTNMFIGLSEFKGYVYSPEDIESNNGIKILGFVAR